MCQKCQCTSFIGLEETTEKLDKKSVLDVKITNPTAFLNSFLSERFGL